MRVGSAAHVHVEGFTCVLCGLRAYSRVNVRVTARVGLSEPRTGARLRVREQPMRPGLLADACVSNPCRRSPGTLTTSPQTALFHRYLARWSALWAPRSSGRSLDGGITPSKAPTRRRHADAALRMAQNPHWPPVWRAPEGVAARRAWPRCRSAATRRIPTYGNRAHYSGRQCDRQRRRNSADAQRADRTRRDLTPRWATRQYTLSCRAISTRKLTGLRARRRRRLH